DLGSRELNLVAASGASTFEEANQPFFMPARLQAVQHLAGPERIALLRSALEDSPQNDAPRIPLLYAAMQQGDYYLALATIKPFLDNSWLSINSSSGTYWERYGGDPADDEDDDTESGT